MDSQKSKLYFDVAPSYKGGHTTIYGGYVYELCPQHPLANRWGFVAQHRLVGEDLIGRPLVQHEDPQIRECVHHKDENRLNNSPDNLEVLTFSAHRKHHTHKRNVEEFEPRRPTREAVENALSSTATIKLAAESLGLCHQTLRKHFPDLLTPYQRRKPTNPTNPSEEQLQILREMAPSSLYGEREVGKRLGLHGRTVRKICEVYGILWVRKSRKGEVHRTHRGKPTPKWLAACASQTAPETPPTEG